MPLITTQTVSTLKHIETMHRGRFSTIHIAEYTRNEKRFKVVAKQVHYKEEPLEEISARRFCEIREEKWKRLYPLRHSNVVQYFEAFFKHMILPEDTPPQALLVMEYFSGGNLQHLLQKEDLPRTLAIDYLKQILLGLEFLHGRKFTHATLHPQSLFIDDCDSLGIFRTIKIGGLDDSVLLDNHLDQNVDLRRFQSSARYMSPEMAQKCRFGVAATAEPTLNPLSTRTDIWSIGVILLELFYYTGKITFMRTKTRPLRHKYLSADNTTPPEDIIKFIAEGGTPVTPSSASKPLRDFCERCFERNPKLRLSATTLLTQQLVSAGGGRIGEFLI